MARRENAYDSSNVPFVPHMEVLSRGYQALWVSLKPTSRMGWVLYGQTAVALRFGHREAMAGYEFFSERPLDRASIQNALGICAAPASVWKETGETVTFRIEMPECEPIFLRFYGRSVFGRVGKPRLLANESLSLASDLDLWGMAVRDALGSIGHAMDLVAFLKEGFDLAVGLGACNALLQAGASFDSNGFLKTLRAIGGQERLTSDEYDDLLEQPGHPLHHIERLAPSDRDLLLRAAREVKGIPSIRRVSESLV